MTDALPQPMVLRQQQLINVNVMPQRDGLRHTAVPVIYVAKALILLPELFVIKKKNVMKQAAIMQKKQDARAYIPVIPVS